MKKLLLGLFLLVLVATLAACGAEQGEYTPGVYHGYTVGATPSIAVVTVDENGMIESVLVDEVYLKEDAEGELSWEGRSGPTTGYATTKRALDDGCGYVMHPGEVVDCTVEGELMWWEQVDALAAAVVEAQGVPTWSLTEGSFTEGADDVVAGVSITVDSYIDAIEDALAKAE